MSTEFFKMKTNWKREKRETSKRRWIRRRRMREAGESDLDFESNGEKVCDDHMKFRSKLRKWHRRKKIRKTKKRCKKNRTDSMKKKTENVKEKNAMIWKKNEI